jgi:alkylhydroperoxidase family enzyme
MYLRDLANADPPPEAGRFAQSIRAARAAGATVPGIHLLFAADPARAKPFCEFVHLLMRGPSPLSPGQRELIAAWTSARNHCLF